MRSPIKLIATQAVGQRERVVLVEVADQWLLLGVAPGQVTALQTLPKATLPDPESRGPLVAAVLASAGACKRQADMTRRASSFSSSAGFRATVSGIGLLAVTLAIPTLAWAQANGSSAPLPAQLSDVALFSSTPAAGGGQNYSLPVQTLLLLTTLTFLPAVLLLMTGFTRIVIVLGLLGMLWAPRARLRIRC